MAQKLDMNFVKKGMSELSLACRAENSAVSHLILRYNAVRRGTTLSPKIHYVKNDISLCGLCAMPVMGKVVTLGECVGVMVIYFVVLLATREFGKEDFSQLKQVLKRG